MWWYCRHEHFCFFLSKCNVYSKYKRFISSKSYKNLEFRSDLLAEFIVRVYHDCFAKLTIFAHSFLVFFLEKLQLLLQHIWWNLFVKFGSRTKNTFSCIQHYHSLSYLLTPHVNEEKDDLPCTRSKSTRKDRVWMWDWKWLWMWVSKKRMSWTGP